MDALTEVVLVLNAGSSSIKFSTFAVEGRGRDLARRHRGGIEGIGSDPRFFALDADGRRVADERVGGGRAGGGDHEDVLPGLLGWIARQTDRSRVVGVGHRVVHGGERFAAPVLVDAAILDQLEKLVPLAPLHQPHNLAAIRAIGRVQPEVAQVACFDTAFHRTQAPIAQLYALPRDLSAAGIKRYGFHGLSYEYIASVLPAPPVTSHADGSWPPTSATAAACARCGTARASRRRWASPRWKGCRWGRGAVRSIPASSSTC